MDERVPFLQNLPTDNARAELLCCCKGLRQLFNRGDLGCCSCSLFTKIQECLGGGDERRRCCCIEVLEKVRECFTTGFNKKDGSSTKNKGKKVVVPDDGPPITDDSFFLLTGLETSSTKLYLEHKALREEVDDHIKEVAMKFGMIMAVATTGSLGVGAVTCSVALEMAGLYCVFLWIILSFVVFIGWNRISGCHSRLKAKIGEQDELIVRLDEMKNAFKKIPSVPVFYF